jgi:dTDP-4-dehydrorhamnose 3,5-epimerase
MSYSVTSTSIPEVLILKPKVFGDSRGYLYESYSDRNFAAATGLNLNFVQDNHSNSKQGVLRGLHYQVQLAQGKLVRVTQGAVFDVAVDIRKSSSTFGKWVGCELNDTNQLQMWIPSGFAHGFLVLSVTCPLETYH